MKKSVFLLALLVLAAAIVAFSVSPAFGFGEECGLTNPDGFDCRFLENGPNGGLYRCHNPEDETDFYNGTGPWCFPALE